MPYPLIYDHGWQMDFPSLEKAVTERTRGVVVVHPNNPTGWYSPNKQESLNRFCREHSLALIADEVFLNYALDRAKRQSFASNQDVLTFTLSGDSKISALKVAWIAASESAAKVAPALARFDDRRHLYENERADSMGDSPLLDQRKSVQAAVSSSVRSPIWPGLTASSQDEETVSAFAGGRRLVRNRTSARRAD